VRESRIENHIVTPMPSVTSSSTQKPITAVQCHHCSPGRRFQSPGSWDWTMTKHTVIWGPFFQTYHIEAAKKLLRSKQWTIDLYDSYHILSPKNDYLYYRHFTCYTFKIFVGTPYEL